VLPKLFRFHILFLLIYHGSHTSCMRGEADTSWDYPNSNVSSLNTHNYPISHKNYPIYIKHTDPTKDTQSTLIPLKRHFKRSILHPNSLFPPHNPPYTPFYMSRMINICNIRIIKPSHKSLNNILINSTYFHSFIKLTNRNFSTLLPPIAYINTHNHNINIKKNKQPKHFSTTNFYTKTYTILKSKSNKKNTTQKINIPLISHNNNNLKISKNLPTTIKRHTYVIPSSSLNKKPTHVNKKNNFILSL